MILTIAAFVAIISFLVLVHELGHFLAAKKFGMAVQEFGIGFPPQLFKKKIKGTTFSVNLIPLGGYVKIKGEDGGNEEDSDSFSAKPVWQRAFVIVSGVLMNVVAGWLLFAVLFMSAAPVELTGDISEKYVKSKEVVISEVLEESPASKAGLASGDVLVFVSGKKIESIDMFQDEIENSSGKEVEIIFLRDSIQSVALVEPAIINEVSQDRHVIGVALSNIGIVRFPPHKALVAATQSTAGYIARITSAFWGVISGFFYGDGLGSLGGPVAIAVVTKDMLELGFARLVIFTAILSFNLVILNILPFPALDGGRLIFLAVEAIRGKPSRKDVESWFHRAGFILLMLAVVFITYRDIVRFGGRIWKAVVG